MGSLTLEQQQALALAKARRARAEAEAGMTGGDRMRALGLKSDPAGTAEMNAQAEAAMNPPSLMDRVGQLGAGMIEGSAPLTGLPMDMISAWGAGSLGQPITLVSSLGMPMSLINNDGTPWSTTWTVPWVTNGGTGWVGYEGAFFGANSTWATYHFLVSGMDTQAAADIYIGGLIGRHEVRINSTGRLVARFRDSTPADLVNWTSAATQRVAGEWLYEVAFSSAASPTFLARKRAKGDLSWTLLSDTGTYTQAPTAGTIHNIRTGQTGPESYGWGLNTGLQVWNGGKIGFLRCSISDTTSGDAFVDGSGNWVQPTAGTPEQLFYGNAAYWNAATVVNKGTGAAWANQAAGFVDA